MALNLVWPPLITSLTTEINWLMKNPLSGFFFIYFCDFNFLLNKTILFYSKFFFFYYILLFSFETKKAKQMISFDFVK